MSVFNDGIDDQTVEPPGLRFDMEDHIHPRGNRVLLVQATQSSGSEALKTGFCSLSTPNDAFVGKFHKTKIAGDGF